jgi:pilus assembly protein CpaB
MGRRALVALVAILAAGIGTFFIWQWVDGYERQVEAQFETVEVYVATVVIGENTRAADLGDTVTLTPVVRTAVVPGAVTDLTAIAGLVADVDILPGEQLLAQRFVDPADKIADIVQRVEPPSGMLEVTFSLPEERLVGGQIRPGDLVAFIGSFDPFAVNLDFVEPGIDGGFGILDPDPTTIEDGEANIVQTPNVTTTVLHKVLVTNLQYAAPPPLFDEEGNPVVPDPREAPQTTLFVTLAAPVGDIERMVFVREFGRVWLALETDDDPEDSSLVVTRGNVFSRS